MVIKLAKKHFKNFSNNFDEYLKKNKDNIIYIFTVELDEVLNVVIATKNGYHIIFMICQIMKTSLI